MLKFLQFACILMLASGCKREYAHFQKTAAENFHRPKKQAEKPLIVQADIENEALEEIEVPAIPEYENIVAGMSTAIPSGNNQLKDKTDLFPKGLFKKKKKKAADNKRGGLFQKQEKRGLFEKNKRRKGFGHGFNERLKIGLVLLGIAIIFALLHINILAIIFGLLAAFFIIRGLRKLF